MTGSRYDLLRWNRWVNNSEQTTRSFEIRHIRLVPGKGQRRTFVAKCKGHMRFFYADLIHRVVGTEPYENTTRQKKDLEKVRLSDQWRKAGAKPKVRVPL